MVQSGQVLERGATEIHCFFVPCVEGGFVGKVFYTLSANVWDYLRDYGFRISAVEDAEVTVYSLETKEVLNEFTIQSGSGVGFMPVAPSISVQSDNPITLQYVHNGSIDQMAPYAGGSTSVGTYSGYGVGLTFIGIRPNQETVLYFPIDEHNEAYFFALETTQLTIDGITRTVEADSYFRFPQPGTHRIVSDKSIVMQLNHWPLEPPNQGLQFSGAVIPCVQTVDIDIDVTLTPIGEAFPMTYIIIGAAAAAVAAVVGFFVMRSRSKKPS